MKKIILIILLLSVISNASALTNYYVYQNTTHTIIYNNDTATEEFNSTDAKTALNYLPDSSNVLIETGTYNLSGQWFLHNTSNILGLSKTGTVINISTSGQVIIKNSSGIVAANMTIKDGTYSNTASASFRLEANGNYTNNNTVRDIIIDSTITETGLLLFVYDGYSMDNNTFTNLTMTNLSGSGFYVNGQTVNGGYVNNTNITNVSALDCGSALYTFSSGFVPTDKPYIKNMTIRDSIANNSWESGFFIEEDPTKNNLTLINTTSNYNGRKPAPNTGSGYFANFNSTLINATGNFNKKYGVYVTRGNNTHISGGNFSNNTLTGIFATGLTADVVYNLTIHNATISNNTQFGIQLFTSRVDNTSIFYNYISGNTYGIYLISNNYTWIFGNSIINNSAHGIRLITERAVNISNNTISGSSTSVHNTYSNVFIDDAASTDNVIYNNTIFYGYGENKSRYGVYTCGTNTRIQYNVMRNAGFTADIFDCGTGTVSSPNIYYPILSTPSNNSTVAALYPPQTTQVNFTWTDPEYPGDELLVARDIDFNLIVVDQFTANDYYLATLESGHTYYWKVRQYNDTSSTYGYDSETWNFTITSTINATGQGIHGVVYELINGIATPIDQATVYIYNSTWSSIYVTGTNGYYLFSGLDNSTYNLYATKNGYETTPSFPVTVNGSIASNNILMKIYISPYVPNFVFEKFTVRGLFGDEYPGVTVNVYRGDALDLYLTGVTDSAGQVVFQLIKDQKYRLTFTGGGISGTLTITIYGKEENYLVTIIGGFPTGGDRNSDITSNLTVTAINSTWSNLSLIYNDTTSSTSVIYLYATNLTTNSTCYQTSTSNSITLNCTVQASGTYQFGFNATSSTYGFFKQDKIINFDVGLPADPLVPTDIVSTDADQTLLQWMSIIIIVLTASLFSIQTVKFGAVIVPLEALTLWAFGWFEPVPGNIVTSFLLLACAVVIGIMVYMRQSEVKVNTT